MTEYRSQKRARYHRKESLRHELRDLQRHLAAAPSLSARAQEIEAELARLEREDAEPSTWLDQLQVAAPCREKWDAMTGDERTRHCGRCDKKVYFLSNMRREEAAELLRVKPDGMCVRLRKRRDGTVVFGDCGPGKKARFRGRVAAAGAVAASAVLAAGGIGAVGVATAVAVEPTYETMGAPLPMPPEHQPPANDPVTVPGEDAAPDDEAPRPETPVRDTSRLRR